MGDKRQRLIALVAFFSFGLLMTFPAGCFSGANQASPTEKKPASTHFRFSSVFPVYGNVYPTGYYYVNLKIGNPPMEYDLDIDSGSDLTWVQCDAPCTGCTKPRNRLYKPKNNIVYCHDPICAAMHSPRNPDCKNPSERCHFEVTYADQGSCFGVLVKDNFPLRVHNGFSISPRLSFGCGYDLKYSGSCSPPDAAGVLGLGNGQASIISQLHGKGLIRNVSGHCLSGRGGGFLFFGDDFVPSSGIVWTPISSNSAKVLSNKHYSAGPAELLFDGKSTRVKSLLVVFDSGSSYTYFNSRAYQATVNLIKTELNGKPLEYAPEDKSLPICWKGTEPFKSLGDVKKYFKPLALSFTNAKNAQLPLPPEGYLIITKDGNVCLGILNGAEEGLGNVNLIGDISLQDRMVIYDNEKQQIGWTPANCDRLPNMDRHYNGDLSQPYPANWIDVGPTYDSGEDL